MSLRASSRTPGSLSHPDRQLDVIYVAHQRKLRYWSTGYWSTGYWSDSLKGRHAHKQTVISNSDWWPPLHGHRSTRLACMCASPINARIKPNTQMTNELTAPGEEFTPRWFRSPGTCGKLKITCSDNKALHLEITGGNVFAQMTFRRLTSWLDEERSCLSFWWDFLCQRPNSPECTGNAGQKNKNIWLSSDLPLSKIGRQEGGNNPFCTYLNLRTTLKL